MKRSDFVNVDSEAFNKTCKKIIKADGDCTDANCCDCPFNHANHNSREFCKEEFTDKQTKKHAKKFVKKFGGKK